MEWDKQGKKCYNWCPGSVDVVQLALFNPSSLDLPLVFSKQMFNSETSLFYHLGSDNSRKEWESSWMSCHMNTWCWRSSPSKFRTTTGLYIFSRVSSWGWVPEAIGRASVSSWSFAWCRSGCGGDNNWAWEDTCYWGIWEQRIGWHCQTRWWTGRGLVVNSVASESNFAFLGWSGWPQVSRRLKVAEHKGNQQIMELMLLSTDIFCWEVMLISIKKPSRIFALNVSSTPLVKSAAARRRSDNRLIIVCKRNLGWFMDGFVLDVLCYRMGLSNTVSFIVSSWNHTWTEIISERFGLQKTRCCNR